MDLTNANSVVSLMNSVLAPASKVGGSSASVSRSFETGNADVDLHDVMLSLQKANIDLQTAVQVRNKLVSAYQSIMSMSI
jgi:flagellar hook-basal body complex protein FliE